MGGGEISDPETLASLFARVSPGQKPSLHFVGERVDLKFTRHTNRGGEKGGKLLAVATFGRRWGKKRGSSWGGAHRRKRENHSRDILRRNLLSLSLLSVSSKVREEKCHSRNGGGTESPPSPFSRETPLGPFFSPSRIWRKRPTISSDVFSPSYLHHQNPPPAEQKDEER